MELPAIHLDAIHFDNPPTDDELTRTLRQLKDFLTQLSGVLFAYKKYPVADEQQKMSKLLGLAVQTQVTIDAFEERSRANIAQPQMHMMPRHQ